MKIRITVKSALNKVFIKDKNDLKQSLVLFEGNVRKMSVLLSDVGKAMNGLKLCAKDGGMFANPDIKEHKESLRDFVQRTVPKLETGFEPQVCKTVSLELSIEYLDGEAVSLVNQKVLAQKMSILSGKFDKHAKKVG